MRKAGQSKVELSRGKQSRVEKSKVEQSRAEQSREVRVVREVRTWQGYWAGVNTCRVMVA